MGQPVTSGIDEGLPANYNTATLSQCCIRSRLGDDKTQFKPLQHMHAQVVRKKRTMSPTL